MMRNANGGLNFNGIHRAGFSTTSSYRSNVRLPTIRCMRHFNDYAVLGLNPFASKSDVKSAYRRLALKYHPDVIRGELVAEKNETFQDIKSAYENLMQKYEDEEQLQLMQGLDEWDEWDEWMGCEGGLPVTYNYSTPNI